MYDKMSSGGRKEHQIRSRCFLFLIINQTSEMKKRLQHQLRGGGELRALYIKLSRLGKELLSRSRLHLRKNYARTFHRFTSCDLL